MKKTLLAAALLAGFAGVAHAQSSVTLYGLVDAGLVHEKTDTLSSKNGLDSGLGGQSRWGIRGSEDLGNGLKGIFTLESGFNVDDGTNTQGRLFGRYAFVGLESASAGRLTLGRTTNLGFMWAAGVVNPFGLSYGRSSIGTTFGYNTGDFGTGSRVNNSAYYYSPVIAGFQGAIGYSFQANADQEVAGTGNNTRLIDAGLKYANGPLNAVLTYQYARTPDAISTRDPKALTVGANYDFGVVAVYAGYTNLKDPINNPGNINAYSGPAFAPGGAGTGFSAYHDKDNQYTLGLSAPLGAGKLMAAYQKTSKSKIDGYAIGYVYDLSKRTNVYAYFNDYDTRNFTSASTHTDIGRRQVAFGVQHKF